MPEKPKPTQLFDEAGKPLEVTDSEAAKQAYLSGKALPLRGQSVAMHNPETGEVVEVAAEDVPQATEAGGSFATTDEYNQAKLQAKWGKPGTALNLAGHLAAGAAGAARGATFGLSDPALVEGAELFGKPGAGRRMREGLKELKEYHPITSGAGEIAGIIGATALSGGAAGPEAAGAALAENVGVRGALRGAVRLTPAAFSDVAGSAVRRAVGAGVEEALGTSAGARILARGAAGAAQGATEAIPFAIGHTISEAELGNDWNNIGEKIVANVTHDALLFGKFGAATGAAHGLLEAAAQRAAPALKDAASSLMWRATNPAKAETKLVNAKLAAEGGTKAVGRQLINEGISGNIEEMLTQVESKLAEKVEKMSAIRGGSQAKVAISDIVKSMREAPLISSGGKEYNLEQIKRFADTESIWKPVEDRISKLEAKYSENIQLPDGSFIYGGLKKDVPVQELLDQRILWDKSLAHDSLNGSKPNEALRSLNRVFEDNIVEAIGAGPGATADTVAELKAAKAAYHKLKFAEKALQNSNDAYQTNRVFGLKDTLLAVGSAASGHPYLSPIAAIGSKYMRRHGTSMAAGIVERLADLGTLKKLSDNTGSEIKRGVVSYFKPRTYNNTGSTKSASDNGLNTRFTNASKKLRRIDPNNIADTLANNTASIGQVAPNVQSSIVSTATRGAMFLFSKLPQGAGSSNRLQPGLDLNNYSDAQKSKFMLYYDTVNNPKTVLDSLQKGNVMPEQIEALQSVYPSLYNEIRGEIVTHIAAQSEKGEPVPYQKRIQRGILFGAPTDTTLSPEFVQAAQAQWHPQNDTGGAAGQPNPNKSNPGRGRPPDLMKTISGMAMDFDKRELEDDLS